MFDRVIQFFTYVGQLKRTFRVGWAVHGLPKKHVESVAAHSFRVALMAMLLKADKCIDQERCIKMALVHDLAESVIGDLCPADSKIDLASKSSREAKAIDYLSSMLSSNNEIKNLYIEYQQKSTEEAKFVRDCDLLDMLMQSCEYDVLLANKSNHFTSNFASAQYKLHNSTMKHFYSELVDSLKDNRLELPKDSNTATWFKYSQNEKRCK